MKKTFKCDSCGKSVTENTCWYKQSKKHYCSQSCYWKDKKGKWIDFSCLNCNKKFKRAIASVKRSKRDGYKIQFCCVVCRRQYKTIHKKSRSEIYRKYNNSSKGKTKKRVWFELKEYLGKETILGNKLSSKCGSNSKLLIHHINGIHIDNRIENLVVLCRSCHAKVHGIMRDGINKRMEVVSYEV